MSEISEIWEALKRANLSYSAMSWNGFDIVGTKAGIDEVRRLLHCEYRMKWFEREYRERQGK